jgi:hypothetical protein
MGARGRCRQREVMMLRMSERMKGVRMMMGFDALSILIENIYTVQRNCLSSYFLESMVPYPRTPTVLSPITGGG